jgi:predicted metal-binding protein
LKKKNFETLYILRDLINELIIDNIDYYVLLNNIMDLLILENKKNKISDEKIVKIIEAITTCDKNISIGLREIHHIEYLFVQLMNIL